MVGVRSDAWVVRGHARRFALLTRFTCFPRFTRFTLSGSPGVSFTSRASVSFTRSARVASTFAVTSAVVISTAIIVAATTVAAATATTATAAATAALSGKGDHTVFHLVGVKAAKHVQKSPLFSGDHRDDLWITSLKLFRFDNLSHRLVFDDVVLQQASRESAEILVIHVDAIRSSSNR